MCVGDFCVVGNKKRKFVQDAEEELVQHTEEVDKLWKWWKQVQMQTATHIGQEQVTSCWSELKAKVSTKQDLQEDLEAFGLMSALYVQYTSFTGRAQRRR